MKQMSKEELLDTVGGTNLTTTLLSTLIRGANTAFEVGKALGGALKRLLVKCPVRQRHAASDSNRRQPHGKLPRRRFDRLRLRQRPRHVGQTRNPLRKAQCQHRSDVRRRQPIHRHPNRRAVSGLRPDSGTARRNPHHGRRQVRQTGFPAQSSRTARLAELRSISNLQ